MPVVQQNDWSSCPMFSRTSCWRCCRSPVTSLSRMPASCSRYTTTSQPQSAPLTAHIRSLHPPLPPPPPQHLQIVDGFSIVLLSTLEQTRCAVVTCDSERVTVAFYSVFWIFLEDVCLQCWFVLTWLVPSETVAISTHVCVHHTVMHLFTVLLYAKPHT